MNKKIGKKCLKTISGEHLFVTDHFTHWIRDSYMGVIKVATPYEKCLACELVKGIKEVTLQEK